LFGDLAAALGHDLVFHLHRFEHDHRRTRRHVVTDRDEQLDDLAGDRRTQCLASRFLARLGRGG
jgi:hypothetical protein